MDGRQNLVAVEPDTVEPHVPAEEISSGEQERTHDFQWDELEGLWENPSRFGWVAPVLAVSAIIAWTGFFIYAHGPGMFGAATSEQWSGWITAWSVPVLLVVALWLLAMRNSRREAARFARTAQSLSRESAFLEERLAVINRELSLARDFIAAQSRDLESLGRIAGERLSEHAGQLQDLIRHNGDEVEAISRVSSTALENMNHLRADLPVISNSARDVANQIGNAGRAANDQLTELVAGLERLSETGTASEQQIEALRAQVGAVIANFGAQAAHLEEIATTRFAALSDKSREFQAELESQESEALASIRHRAAALAEELAARSADQDRNEETALAALRERIAQVSEDGDRIAAALRENEDQAAERWTAAIAELEERMERTIREIKELEAAALENARQRLAEWNGETQQADQAMAGRMARFDEEISRRRDAADESETAALAALEERFARMDAQISERQDDYLAHFATLAEKGDALAARLSDLGTEMERAASQGDQARSNLAEGVEALSTSLNHSRESLQGTGEMVDQLSGGSARLLETIRTAARHGSEDLPQAIAAAEERLAEFTSRTDSLQERLDEAGRKGEILVGHVGTAHETAHSTLGELDLLHEQLAGKADAHVERLSELHGLIAQLAAESDTLAERARGELIEAITSLEQTARNVIADLQGQQGEAISSLAEQIGADSAEAVARAVRGRAEGAIQELEDAAGRAGRASEEAAIQLRGQLVRVDELAGNLERRVAEARDHAEERVNDDFSRRMALITDSLNANAIDIGKALSTEVADTAWASYLRGDRGIFTRRTVRLLDKRDARRISDIYEEDGEFRESVSRYVRDFEAMLRSVLSTREGNSLAITLLSSDMGKLYVALAQATDRLRK